MKKQNKDNKKNNWAADSGVGDIECPPAGDAEKTYVEKINIDKVDYFTQPKAVNNIADGPTGNYGEGPGIDRVAPVVIDIKQKEGQNEKSRDEIIIGWTEISTQSSTLIEDQVKFQKAFGIFRGG